MLKIERKIKLVGGIVMGALVVGGVGANVIGMNYAPNVEASAVSVRRLGDVYDGQPANDYCVFNIPVGGVDVPWIASGYNDAGYSMVMAMRNVCTLDGVDCTEAMGQRWDTAAAGLWVGNNRDPGYFAPLNQVFNRLPAVIDGMPRENAIRKTIWDMSGVSSATTSFTRIPNYNAVAHNHLNLVSYVEWMFGFDNGTQVLPANAGWDQDCLTNSIGARFIHARFGHTSCRTQNPHTAPATHPPTTTGLNQPWLRSADPTSTSNVWRIVYNNTRALTGPTSMDPFGLLPVMWINSDIEVGCGSWNNLGAIDVWDPPYDSDDLTIRAVVGEFIEIELDEDEVELVGLVAGLEGGGVGRGVATARVSTNLPNGFTLNIATEGGEDMVHEDGIATFSALGVLASPGVLNADTSRSAWGWRLLTDGADVFRRVDDGGVDMYWHDDIAYRHPISIEFGAWAARSQVAGEYFVEVRLTAVGKL